MPGKKPLSRQQLIDLLEYKYRQYSTPAFIEEDPVMIPHLFTEKCDREISGFLTATIAWGQRPVILRNALKLMQWMDHDPWRFIKDASPKDLKIFSGFCHRTFNGKDCLYYLKALKALYAEKSSMEDYFIQNPNVANQGLEHRISAFRQRFFSFRPPARTLKHFSDPLNNSACKRFNMFLRWMVRSDENGVDFGIWKAISPAHLMLPLDVHSGRMARQLGLLERKQNDWKAVVEVTSRLRKLDPDDPVKYDFALFGMGVFEAGEI